MTILPMLEGLRGRAWLHMPGHGGYMPWLEAHLDATELPFTDDLNRPAPGGAIEAAQREAALAAGAAQTLFLCGGATLGIQAMLLSFAGPGDVVILPRDAHKSAIAACVLGGLRPVYVWPRALAGRLLVTAQDIARAIRENPRAKAVLVTRPDYFGACVDMLPIAQAARETGAALLVDEAHGAHLPYGGDIPSSGALGADAWVQSAHKTLPALTQSAYLHLRDAAMADVARERVALLSSTSPSFLLAASLDDARARMQQEGARAIGQAISRNRAFVERAAGLGFADPRGEWREAGFACDETRIVLDAAAAGHGAQEVLAHLTRQGVDIEMADERLLLALPPLLGPDNDGALDRLYDALACLPPGEFAAPEAPVSLPPAEAPLTPRQAALGARELIPLERAAGRIAAQPVGVYPPGVPWAMPGERFTQEQIQALLSARASGLTLFGCTPDGFVGVYRGQGGE